MTPFNFSKVTPSFSSSNNNNGFQKFTSFAIDLKAQSLLKGGDGDDDILIEDIIGG